MNRTIGSIIEIIVRNQGWIGSAEPNSPDSVTHALPLKIASLSGVLYWRAWCRVIVAEFAASEFLGIDFFREGTSHD